MQNSFLTNVLVVTLLSSAISCADLSIVSEADEQSDFAMTVYLSPGEILRGNYDLYGPTDIVVSTDSQTSNLQMEGQYTGDSLSRTNATYSYGQYAIEAPRATDVNEKYRLAIRNNGRGGRNITLNFYHSDYVFSDNGQETTNNGQGEPPWPECKEIHWMDISGGSASVSYLTFENGDCNKWGCYEYNGGCNQYGCWQSGELSCTEESREHCSPASNYALCDLEGDVSTNYCFEIHWMKIPGGSPSPKYKTFVGGGCNKYGCYEHNGGCNQYGCWQSGEDRCSATHNRQCSPTGQYELCDIP